MQSFSFIPLMTSEKKIFDFFFREFSLSVAMATNQNQRFGLIVGEGLLQKHFCIFIFIFFIYLFFFFFFKISAVTQK